MRNTIENTAVTVLDRGNPLDTFPAMIEASERRGQRQLVASESLPTETGDHEALKALGFVLGEPFADDRLFMPATLPAGWKKRGTDHSMWSEIVDDKGRVRVKVFYKAAFYDRSANMYLKRRYQMRADFAKDYTSVSVRVLDGESEIHRTRTFTGAKRDVFAAEDALYKEAGAWMDANRPNHADPVKQWDEP